MRIACVSDTHGHYPAVPECDLLILAGDYCGGGDSTTRLIAHHKFCDWVDLASNHCDVVGIAGNHDKLFERSYENIRHPNWTYLRDSGTIWNGLKIWGTPWQPRFFDWAFNLDEPELAQRWKLIPHDTDILVLHGPPNGIADFSSYGREHCGSKSLRETIEAIQPRLVVCGHIHSAYGQYQLGATLIVSSSLCNDKYQAVNPIQVISLP